MKIIIAWLICCLIWGTTWIFIKIGLETLPPLSFVSARFVVALLLLGAIMFFLKIPLPKSRRDWLFMALTGFLSFTVNYGLLFWGEQYISSGLAAVLQAMIPLFGVIFGRMFLPNEKITAWKIGGIMLGIGGIAFIFSEQLQISGKSALLGSAAVVVGAATTSFGNVLIKAFYSASHPLTLTFSQMFCGAIPIIIFAAAADGNPLALNWTKTAIICVLYLAVAGSVFAFWLYYYLIQKISIVNAMIIALVTPILAIICGAVFRGEQMPSQTAAGGILVLMSVALILFGGKFSEKRRGETIEQL